MSENSSLLVKTKICPKDNFELVDYDCANIITNKLNIIQSGTLIRSKRDTFFIEGTEDLKKKEIQLLKIIKDTQNEAYFIHTGEYTKDLTKLIESDSAYMVYKNSFFEEQREKKENIFYKLSEGDIIKLGRVFIKILSINIGKKKQEQTNITNINDTYKKENISKNNFSNSIIFNKERHLTSLKKNSSCSSFFINGQEIIKGSCSGIYYNEEEDEKEDDIFLVNKNKLKRTFFFKKKLILPRVTSSKDFFTKNPKKLKVNHKLSFNLILDKNNKNNENIKTPIKNNKVCRICYGEEEKTDKENPLISPCTCKGSMKYIHYKCLKNWLESKIESSPFSSIELKDNIGMSYCTDNLICELCKSKFPDYINYKGKLLNLTFYRTKFEKFLIFESFQVDNNDKKFIHILSFDKTNKLTIGRANECDISFPEITVSRHHCFIHYNEKNNNLYLEDNCSRFGSLILIQNPILLMLDKLTLKIQKNKTYMKLKLFIPFSFFSCCSINNSPFRKYNSYQEQIEPNLNIFKCLQIKKNNDDSEEDNEEENDNYEEKICHKKKKNNYIKIINTQKIKKLDDNLFLLRLKNIAHINKFNNLKKYKKNLKLKELSLNKDNSTKNQNSKDIDIHNLIKTKRISILSSGKEENPKNKIRFNININNRNLENINLFSLNNIKIRKSSFNKNKSVNDE